MANLSSVTPLADLKERDERSAFEERLVLEGLDLSQSGSTTLQLNIGKPCNQTCEYYYLNAGPARKELMNRETVDRALEWITAAKSVCLVDVTGGAPAMNAQLRYLLSSLKKIRPEVGIIDRCNLTILLEP